jgi:hypothetical protein
LAGGIPWSSVVTRMAKHLNEPLLSTAVTSDEWASLVMVLLLAAGLSLFAFRLARARSWWSYAVVSLLVGLGAFWLLVHAVLYGAGCENDCETSEQTALSILFYISATMFLALIIVPPAKWLLSRRGPRRANRSPVDLSPRPPK